MVSKHLKLLIFAFFLGLTACSKDKDDKKEPPKLSPGLHEGILNDARPPRFRRQLRITDSTGMAIAGAQVLIGNALDQPFENNFLTTDANGVFTAPKKWTSEQTVTIAAPGYLRASFLQQSPSGQTFVLRKTTPKQDVELSGETTGFKIKDRDGIVDFGFVMAALNKQDLFNFDVTKVISSEMDQISILGKKVDIPTNVTLPKQKESYMLPFTLEKPKYRMKFSQPGPTQVYAARGQFPLKQVIDQLQNGKDFYELVDYFSFQAGAVKTLDLRVGRNNSDIAIDEVNFNSSKSVIGPVVENHEVVMTASVSESLGVLYPTDIKTAKAGQNVKLMMAPNSSTYLLAVLKNKDELTAKGKKGLDRVSAAILPFTDKMTPQFLPLLDDPHIQSMTHVLLSKVTNVAGLIDFGTYLLLSEVLEKQVGNYTFEYLNNQWEVYAPTWVDDVNLPAWPNENIIGKKLRWEASFIAAPLGTQTAIGPDLLNLATHATHASSDF